MTNHHDIHDADLQGMKDAAARHGVTMSEPELANQYREIQSRINTLPTIQIPAGAVKYDPIPVQRIAKGAGMAVSVVAVGSIVGYAVYVGMVAVFTWCAANALAIGIVFVSGCAVVLIGSSIGSGGETQKTEYGRSSGSSGGNSGNSGGDHYEWHFYNRSNNANGR